MCLIGFVAYLPILILLEIEDSCRWHCGQALLLGRVFRVRATFATRNEPNIGEFTDQLDHGLCDDNRGTLFGTAKASGMTISEFLVPTLNAIPRLAPTLNFVCLAILQPMIGATMANAV